MKLSKENISFDKINIYILFSFFLLTLSYFLTKSFITSKEISDNIFLISCVLIFEIVFLIIINNLENINLQNKTNFLIYFGFFLLIYFLWSHNLSKNLTFFIYFISYQILFSIFVILNEYKIKKLKDNQFANILFLFVATILCSGLLYQIEELNFSIIYTIIIISLLYLLIIRFSKNYFKKNFFVIDILLSLLIFIILIKAFLLSAPKDSFHYSWYLGPAYSSMAGGELLIDTVSQYGYFSILFIKYFSYLTQINLDTAFVLLIVIFFILFFFLFLNIISKVIKYPLFILTLFLCLSIFGTIGISNLSGAMYIPSSSVYRFFPALITTYFLSRIIVPNHNNFNLNSFCFILFFLISIFWSFESLFFIIFAILALFFALLLDLFFLKKNDQNKKIFTLNLNQKMFFIILSILFVICFYVLSLNKDLTLFYEYVFGFEGLKTLEILNSRTSILFISFLLINFLIVRLSFNPNERLNFLYNFLWLALFISFSSYFVARSHPNNAFSLFPFFIFFLCILKISTQNLTKLREVFVKAFISFTIISSLSSIYFDKDIFFTNLFSSKFLETPIFNNKNYNPSELVEKELILKKDIPVTLITGSSIHNANNKLNKGGFGLPILPLEQFNILSTKRKESLMKKFFKRNNQHLILCLVNCDFYNEENEKKTWESIYLSKNINVTKILETNRNPTKEILYLLQSK